MTTSNIYGSPGPVGPKGMLGPTGAHGPRGMTTEDTDEMLLKQYGWEGFEMKWRMKDGTRIKIKDMEDSHIRNCVNMLRRNEVNETRKAWIEIFTDVQIKRRRLKLEKIKNKLNPE